jgi:hypothetical protein
LKLEATAGDHLFRMKELEESENKALTTLAELEITNSRLTKENKLFREFVLNNRYQLDIEKV